MKKTYVKPMIQFEDFKISASIAETCRLSPSHADGNSCGYTIDTAIIIFVSDETCTYTPEQAGTDICYHVPTGDSNIFGS